MAATFPTTVRTFTPKIDVTDTVYADHFKKSGDTVTPDSGSIALGLKTTAGSANLLETRNAANTLRFVVDYDGIPKVGTAAVLYVGSAAYTTLNTTATAANTTAQGNPFNPFLLAGI